MAIFKSLPALLVGALAQGSFPVEAGYNCECGARVDVKYGEGDIQKCVDSCEANDSCHSISIFPALANDCCPDKKDCDKPCCVHYDRACDSCPQTNLPFTRQPNIAFNLGSANALEGVAQESTNTDNCNCGTRINQQDPLYQDDVTIQSCKAECDSDPTCKSFGIFPPYGNNCPGSKGDKPCCITFDEACAKDCSDPTQADKGFVNFVFNPKSSPAPAPPAPAPPAPAPVKDAAPVFAGYNCDCAAHIDHKYGVGDIQQCADACQGSKDGNCKAFGIFPAFSNDCCPHKKDCDKPCCVFYDTPCAAGHCPQKDIPDNGNKNLNMAFNFGPKSDLAGVSQVPTNTDNCNCGTRINGQNPLYQDDVTIQSCKAECDSEPTCKSFGIFAPYANNCQGPRGSKPCCITYDEACVKECSDPTQTSSDERKDYVNFVFNTGAQASARARILRKHVSA